MGVDNGDKIHSGSEIVATFVDSLEGQSDLDPGTVASIKSLHEKSKLSKTNLIRALEEQRSSQAVKSKDTE